MFRNISTAFCFSALLTACGGNFYTGPSGTLSAEDAATQKSAIQSAVTLSLSKPAEVPQVGGSRADATEACTTVSGDHSTDGDADGIPKSKTRTFACSGIGDNQEGLTGTASIADKDDTNALGGFRYDFDVEGTYNIQSRSGTKKYTIAGFFDMLAEGGALKYTSNFQSTDEYTYNGMGGIKLIGGSTWNHTITPDADPATGTATMGGYWGYKVEVTGTPAGAPTALSIVLGVSSENLTWQKDSCSNFFKSGSITFVDGSSNALKFVYNSCSSVTVTYNDAAVP